MNRSKRFIESIRLQESSQIQVHIPDELDLESKLKLIKEIEKTGKQTLDGVIFTEHKKFLQRVIDIVCSDKDLIKSCHKSATKLGYVLLLNQKTLKKYKSLSNQFKDIECIITMDSGYELTSFLKLEINDKISGSNKNHKKQLMWRDLKNSVSLVSLIFDIYFLEFQNKSLLSDEIYTEEGEKSLDKLIIQSINRGWNVYLVVDRKIEKRIRTSEEYITQKLNYFGYDIEKRDFRFLIEKN